MANSYEYSFNNIDDYVDFGHNCYLDYPEIVIKPIIDHYHTIPSQLSITMSTREIVVTGQIYSHSVNVTYTPDYIKIIFYHQYYCTTGRTYFVEDKRKYITMYDENQRIVGLYPWVYHKGKIPNKLPPIEGDPDATIIIQLQIPAISNYFWNLWNDHIPLFNDVVDRFAIYIRVFYINLDDYIFDPSLKIPDVNIDCTDVIISQIRGYATEMDGHTLDPLAAHRNIISACMRWKVYIYARQYNHCMKEIQYMPGLGVDYQKAMTEFTQLICNT